MDLPSPSTSDIHEPEYSVEEVEIEDINPEIPIKEEIVDEVDIDEQSVENSPPASDILLFLSQGIKKEIIVPQIFIKEEIDDEEIVYETSTEDLTTPSSSIVYLYDGIKQEICVKQVDDTDEDDGDESIAPSSSHSIDYRSPSDILEEQYLIPYEALEGDCEESSIERSQLEWSSDTTDECVMQNYRLRAEDQPACKYAEVIGCSHCSDTFPSLESLVRHINAIPLYICGHCSDAFTTRMKLLIHVKVHKKCNSFKCGACFAIFKSTEMFFKHVAYKKFFQCKLCLQKFRVCAGLRRHIQSYYFYYRELFKQNDYGYYVCKICSESFATADSLHKHISSPSKVILICDTCHIIFAKRGKQKQSMIKKAKTIHTGRMNFPCNLCPKVFPLYFLLKHHVNKHIGEGPYLCEICY